MGNASQDNLTLADLYDAYEAKMLRYAVIMVGDPYWAEDLVQDTFMRSIAHLPLLASLEPYQRLAWLRTVLKNRFIDQQRARQREQEMVQQIIQDTEFAEDDLIPLLTGELLELAPEKDRELLIQRTVQHKMKIIPAGFELVEKPLMLNNFALESLPAQKIYCTEWVRIDSNVSAEMLDKNLDSLISEERVYCPDGLKNIIAQKCDWLRSNLELYDGELWIIEDERQLPVYAFDQLDGLATLVVFGELVLDPQITPEILTGRLAKVHNFGSIRCTPEQMGALYTILGVSEGQISEATKPPKQIEVESEDDDIKETYVNVNYLRL